MSRRRVITGAVLGLALALPLAAQGPGTGPGATAPGERREALRQQVHERFMTMVSQRLELTGAQRTQLDRIVKQSAEERQALGQKGRELRRRLGTALSAQDTPEREFRSILDELTDLREEELRLWRQEQDAIEKLLSPRQAAQFLAMRHRFAQRVRGVRGSGGWR